MCTTLGRYVYLAHSLWLSSDIEQPIDLIWFTDHHDVKAIHVHVLPQVEKFLLEIDPGEFDWVNHNVFGLKLLGKAA